MKCYDEKDVKKYNSLVAYTLLALLSVILFINVLIISSYVKLQQSRPLENFNGSFISPISLSKDDRIVGTGSYDRDIICKMTSFDIRLTNTKTNDIVLIGPRSLLVAPPVNLTPGKNIPISFVVSIPETLYPGVWSTTFHGGYICRNGLFTAEKDVSIQLSSLKVTK